MATKRTGGARPPDTPVPWVVLKFGGTSVSTADRWATILRLVKERQSEGLRPVVVHSALATVSNRLDELLRSAVESAAAPSIEEIKALHFQLALALGVDGPAVLGEYFAELEQLIAGVHLIREVSPKIQARVMTMGELLATRLG
ncbi:MAG: bifunctional aspartate kinase/diaminopimelate decarboxylase, partial [Gammaproteobacteria bacterium]|nr:bifunctional aspartate kinase/diaminopimelate decarboxylase [Gammaproteobacteria bacterium]